MNYPPELARADHLLTADEVRQKYEFHGEHPRFQLRDWRDEVNQHSTLRGYWEWVESQLEQEHDNVD